jgi:hypothetical protein
LYLNFVHQATLLLALGKLDSYLLEYDQQGSLMLFCSNANQLKEQVAGLDVIKLFTFVIYECL